jgi:hypothetical protein
MDIMSIVATFGVLAVLVLSVFAILEVLVVGTRRSLARVRRRSDAKRERKQGAVASPQQRASD